MYVNFKNKNDSQIGQSYQTTKCRFLIYLSVYIFFNNLNKKFDRFKPESESRDDSEQVNIRDVIELKHWQASIYF